MCGLLDDGDPRRMRRGPELCWVRIKKVDRAPTRQVTADYEPSTLEARTLWYTERMQKGFPVFVAEEGDEILGWSSLSPYHTRIGYRFSA